MMADKWQVKCEKNPGVVSALQVYGARAGKCTGKLVMADHRNVDSHKIPYMMADKWQEKCEKNPGVVSGL
jgi:hypothetical protein